MQDRVYKIIIMRYAIVAIWRKRVALGNKIFISSLYKKRDCRGACRQSLDKALYRVAARCEHGSKRLILITFAAINPTIHRLQIIQVVSVSQRLGFGMVSKSYQNPFALADGWETHFAGQRQHKAPVMLDGVRGYWAGTIRNYTCSGWRFLRWRMRR